MYVEDQSGNIRAYMQQAAENDLNAANSREEAAREHCRPFMVLRPKIFPDGDKWCVLYGENIQDGICAFGNTPAQAAVQFDWEWLHALPHNVEMHANSAVGCPVIGLTGD